MKRALVGVLLFSCAASLAEAQQGPALYDGSNQGNRLPAVQQGQNGGPDKGGPPPAASNFTYQRGGPAPLLTANYPGPGAYYPPPPPPSSNFGYQRCDYAPYCYGTPPSAIYANGTPPAAIYGPQGPQPVPAAAPPPPPPVVDPYNPYRYVASQIVPPPIIRREEPVYQGPPQLEEPIPFHRCCKDTFFFSADYMGAFIRQMRIPILVTTGSPTDPFPGVLGQPNTSVLLGNQIDFGMSSGVRLEAGVFLDEKNHFSLEWNGFLLLPNTQKSSFSGDANGNPVLVRPFFNTEPFGGIPVGEFGLVNSQLNTATGTLSVETKSILGGVELNSRYHGYWGERLHADALFGLRYLRLSEGLTLNENVNPIANNFLFFQGQPVNAPNSLSDYDSFQTTNQFFGAQIGGRVSWEYKWLNLDAFGKLGLGATLEQVNINGSTTLMTPAGNQTAAGGLYAQPSNIGSYNRTVLGFVPEFGINCRIEVTNHMRIRLGYTGLLWNRVARPGNEIDRDVNFNLIPSGGPNFGVVTGPVAPGFHFNDEFFFVHSFNAGIEFHY